MLDQTANPAMNIQVDSPFMTKYPSFNIYIESVEISEIQDDLKWLCNTHKFVSINEGEFFGVIHKGMAGILHENISYTIWFDRPDKYDRYIEIVLVRKI